MTPAEPIRLIIIRGDECIHEKEGYYGIWTFSKDGGVVVSIKDGITDEILFDELPIKYITMSAPFVHIITREE